jgi:predicted N-acyltransferase
MRTPASPVRCTDLTRDFFAALSGAVGDAVMLIVAEEAEPGGGGEIIAGALNLVGSQARFGGAFAVARPCTR